MLTGVVLCHDHLGVPAKRPTAEPRVDETFPLGWILLQAVVVHTSLPDPRVVPCRRIPVAQLQVHTRLSVSYFHGVAGVIGRAQTTSLCFREAVVDPSIVAMVAVDAGFTRERSGYWQDSQHEQREEAFPHLQIFGQPKGKSNR